MTIADKLNDLNDNIIVINNEVTSQEGLIDQILDALNGKGISNAKATFSYTNNHATFLAPSTFYECDAFHELILPVAGSVAQSAFAYCNNLETVRMPVCGSLDGSAFINCTNLKEVEIPMCSSIQDSTFEGCENLTTLILGSKCTYIGHNAFNGCGNLTTFVAPDCSQIGSQAFMYCIKLSEATFTNVNEIGDNAFYGAGLTSFFIPSGCQVGPNAFAYCGSLTNIYTGDTMEAVSEWANGNPGENIFHGVGASCINCIDGTYFLNGSMKPAPYSLEEE